MTTSKLLTHPFRVAAVAIASLAVGACASDGPSNSSASGESGDPPTGPVASGEIAVRAIDHAYLDLPQRMQAGSTLTLANASEVEAHEIVAIRLPDDETRSAAELVQLPEAELGALFGGVRTVVLAAPESDGVAVVGDGSLDEAGRYLVVCMIPTGADPDEYITAAATSDGPPNVDGGPPHIVQGMFGEVTVVG